MTTEKQLTTIDVVLLGAVTQLNEIFYKEEAGFEAECISPSKEPQREKRADQKTPPKKSVKMPYRKTNPSSPVQ